jgi:hypothetical protein
LRLVKTHATGVYISVHVDLSVSASGNLDISRRIRKFQPGVAGNGKTLIERAANARACITAGERESRSRYKSVKRILRNSFHWSPDKESVPR